MEIRRQKTLLLLKETSAQTKVQEFLAWVSRNSNKTTRVYLIGLSHFQTFLSETERYEKLTLETVVESLTRNEIDVYKLLDDFVAFIISKGKHVGESMSSKSLLVYLAAVKSFLAYYDIDVVASKFKRKVRVPKCYREDEQAIDAADIRKILLTCNNRRLKAVLLVLSSGGMRTVEALSIRNKDIDFSVSPTKIHIRKEYCKTRVARDIYISDESTLYLKQWMDWKNRSKKNGKALQTSPDNLVFTHYSLNKNQVKPEGIYIKVMIEFQKLLEIAQMNQRKEGLLGRRKVTLNSLRRFVKTVISNHAGNDYSEWFLGHSKSPYWTLKEPAKREIYGTKCMKYLTFLDYSNIETPSKNIELKLEERDKQIEVLAKKQEKTDLLIQSLIDSGHLRPRTKFESI
ncbi:MAG: site-specific integrase [Thaumarchaeota archaeon]|nr:MAG: site-specific integrase [Nitrososphaerota archaeon]